ncbi:MAG: flagellar basal body-associated FliL family protein [Candidatus Wallbacteria bacterium]|nr:flagellar basal body-associated FliL family protein [Candidatus Wallbacteria bacterium]
MADEEKNTVLGVGKISPLNKILLFGIAGILLILAITCICIVTITFMSNKQAAVLVNSGRPPVVATYGLKEFLVSTRDNQGIIKAEIELGLSDLKMADLVSKNLGEIRDSVNRILTSKNLGEANESFASKELHREILESVNEVLTPHLKVRASFFRFNAPPQVVDVHFLNFFAK